jgi:triosephosphate isomerase (TIM)
VDNKKIVIANWKMNPATLKEAERLFSTLDERIEMSGNLETIICPPFVYLSPLINLSKHNLVFGGQDCFWEKQGAYTGEVSSAELKSLGCEYVLIGHSERKRYFQEDDSMINKKLKAALASRLIPVLCVGEEIRDDFDSEGRALGELNPVIAEQIEKALIDINPTRVSDIIIAYEPVWAISTTVDKKDCSSNEAMKAALFIRKILIKLYSRLVAEKVRIIYGGSVDSLNVTDYVEGANLDGVLVGGASLNASEFVRIIERLKAVS